MKYRTYVKDLKKNIGADVFVAGWLDKIRDMKKMQFIVLRDSTGYVQIVNEKNGKPIDGIISDLKEESALTVEGRVIENQNVKLGQLEIQLNTLDIHSVPQGPIPIKKDSNIDARLDWRYLDLRDPAKRMVLQIQTTAEQAMREYWLANDFIEIHSPKLVEGASESGAELFKLDYFGKKASLAQSPQFYKQMAMAAGLEKVFEIGPVFRANPSFTARHDTEFTSVDMEISWINSHEDVMKLEEEWINYFLSRVKEKHGEDIQKTFNRELVVPKLPFPRITMENAQKILSNMGYDGPKEDLNPEGERKLYEHVKKEFDHDFVFVTEYPAHARAFYHMRFDDRPKITKSFDLLWKGLEVTTGAQREHRVDRLVKQAIERDVDVEGIKSYIDFFKYGVPSHGGCGFGLTRMLMNITGLPSVKDVTYVYRGPTRLTP